MLNIYTKANMWFDPTFPANVIDMVIREIITRVKPWNWLEFLIEIRERHFNQIESLS